MLRVAYSQALMRLTQPARVAFASGCVEHVVPSSRRLFESVPLLEALDAAWRAVLSRPLGRVEQATLENRVRESVPHIEGGDSDLQDELGMNLGVLVVDLLACAAGDESVAEGIGLGTLNVLTVAIDVLKGEDPGDWAADLEHPERLHPLLREEWEWQRKMLSELAAWQDSRLALTWREAQRGRGRDLAARLSEP